MTDEMKLRKRARSCDEACHALHHGWWMCRAFFKFFVNENPLSTDHEIGFLQFYCMRLIRG